MRPEQPDWALAPDWPATLPVRALASTRAGGVSSGRFSSLNLHTSGEPGDDDPQAVAENRRRFAAALGAAPCWLRQVHGADVVTIGGGTDPGAPPPVADAAVTAVPGVACVVMVADCLPVLFCAAGGRAVGAAHAGWRGLAAGVLQNTVDALCTLAACRPSDLAAWIGPAIGPDHFEVGADVLQAFGADPQRADVPHFRRQDRADGSPRWRADLLALARERLGAAGVRSISGGTWCTHADASRFFSFRRDGRTGRMAAAIAITA